MTVGLEKLLVVTGSSGFLGSALVRRVKALPASFEVLPVARSRPGQGIAVDDYRDTPCPENAVLVHLAETNDVGAIADDDGAGERSFEIASALCDMPFAFKIYASSTVVYRPGLGRPRRPHEADAWNPYARMKLRNEARFLAAGGTVLRFTNLYGSADGARNSVLDDIVSGASNGLALRLRNTAAARDFLHVDDAADAVLAAVTARRPGIFNIASGRSVTVGELAGIALQAMGKSDMPVECDRAHANDRLDVNVSAAAKELGWRSRISLEQGIEAIVARR